MLLTSRTFFQFSGFHSLLIGLLPFFLPVWLWSKGATLGQICGFISLSGIGFILSLWFWDRSRYQRRWKQIIIVSFLAEILLLASLLGSSPLYYLFIAALLNGAYNCFYWSTQRAIFSKITSSKNTGKTFGNFQILVVITLKLGILTGGFLLEQHGLLSILLLSCAISSLAIWQLFSQTRTNYDAVVQNESRAAPMAVKEIVRFRDSQQSRSIFLLDGPLLFLESYFWVLSLYFLAGHSFFKLSLIVVILTLLLSIIFYLIKNRIDHLNQQRVFTLAVLLYSFSWLLRALLGAELPESLVYTGIILVGFCTTFFRLAFNKRFFDVAQKNQTSRYLVCKSYFSQMSISLFFGAFAVLTALTPQITTESAQNTITLIYVLACPIALFYAIYANKTCKTPNLMQELGVQNLQR